MNTCKDCNYQTNKNAHKLMQNMGYSHCKAAKDRVEEATYVHADEPCRWYPSRWVEKKVAI